MKNVSFILILIYGLHINILSQVKQEWIARYSAPPTILNYDYGTAITTDKFNNIYVIGTSMGNEVGFKGKEFVTIKYNTQGNILWTARYSNYLGDNIARGLAVDELGNVYVTGKSYNGLNYDFTTLKYDSDGNLKWSQTFTATGNGDDLPVGIVIVGTNNIYVAGTSYIDGIQKNNYITIKYDSSGNEQWMKSYGSGEGGNDSATAITVGEKGFIYVTGKSKGSADQFFFFANLKYDSLGNQIWVRKINDYPTPVGDYIPKSILVDTIGNMYIAGTCFSGSTNEDFVTVKYRPGELAWIRKYNGPSNLYDSPAAMYVDNKLNVYVTGQSYGHSINLDFATIKYDPNGDTAWVRRYIGGFGNDYPYDITVDDSGNVFVIGFGASGGVIVKYDSAGAQKTTQGFSGYPNAISLDSDNNILITGQTSTKTGGGYDLVTIKYDNSLNEIWGKSYSAPIIQQDEVTSMAVDPGGNIYLGGYTYVTKFSDLDMLLVKYNSSGILQWSKRINSSANGTDYIRAITTDQNENVYITGVGAGSGYDYLTIKYDSNGDTVWTARYMGNDPSQFGYDEPWAIVVDKEENVFVTGESYDSNTGYDWATIKYDSSGVMKWVKRYDGILGSTDENSFDLVLDHNDNIIVTGFSPGNMTSADFLTIKYNQNGDTLWTSRYDGTGSGYDYATRVIVDSLDNIYITGRSDGINTQEDFATIKYDSNGVQQWVRRYDGSGQDDEPKDIAVIKNGEVVVTGFSTGASTGRDFLSIKYSSSGDTIWTRRFNGASGSGYDEANSLTGDNDGNIYVTGYSEDNSFSSNFYTIAYDSGGNKLWDEIYNGTGSGDDNAKRVSLDKDGNIYVAGTSLGDSTGLDFALIKYSLVTTGINDYKNIIQSFFLEQNYPNPFNPTTVISWQLPVRSHVSLKIYDILGREVTTLVDEVKPAGKYIMRFDASRLASGIYFYQLKAGGFINTKKMILLK
jgi:uncharacterized delta-60 repeat protein